MKRIFCLLTSFLLVAGIYAQKSYKVDFYIHEIEDTILYINSYCGGEHKLADSIRVKKDGSFKWVSGPMHEGMYMVKDQKKRDMFSFLLGKSDKFSIEIYDNGEAIVKDCRENDAYFLYQKENRKYQSAMYQYQLLAQSKPEQKDSLYALVEPVMDSFHVFQKSFFETYPDNLISVVSRSLMLYTPSAYMENGKVKKGMERQYAYHLRKHYWDSFQFSDSRILYTPYFISKFNSYVTEATVQNPDSVCVALDDFVAVALRNKGVEYADYVLSWYLVKLPSMPFSYNELLYYHIVNKYSDYLTNLISPSELELHKDRVKKIERFLPGKQMPNIVANDINGVPQSLYASNHRFTVLYFFSSDCESCKKNIDVLKDLYSMNKNFYDVEIFAIDVDQDEEHAKQRQKDDPFPWIVTFKNISSLQEYGFALDHTPELYILDKNKVILNKTAMYEHVEKTMDALMPAK